MNKYFLQSICVFCGRECNFDEMICMDCVTEHIKPVTKRCCNCGYGLPVSSFYCAHCNDNIDFYHNDYYYNGAIRKAVLSIKFHWRLRAVNQIKELVKFSDLDFEKYTLITKVPCHLLRKFVRFIHPLDIIADAVFDAGYKVTNISKRTVNTPYQATLSKQKRFRNVKGAFELIAPVKDESILILDDILTTGATVNELAKVFKISGAARVDVFTLLAGVR